MRNRRLLLGSIATLVGLVGMTHCAQHTGATGPLAKNAVKNVAKDVAKNGGDATTAPRAAPPQDEPTREPESIGPMGAPRAAEDLADYDRSSLDDDKEGPTASGVAAAGAHGRVSAAPPPAATSLARPSSARPLARAPMAPARSAPPAGAVSTEAASPVGRASAAKPASKKAGLSSEYEDKAVAAEEPSRDEAAPSRRHGPRPSGSIRAGEWDDNANYREFMKYVGAETRTHQSLHSVDLSARRFLVVRDNEGMPVPRCRVRVTDESGHDTTLTTVASGRAVLFPRAEGLRGTRLRASTECEGSNASAAFTLDSSDGLVELKLGGGRHVPAIRTIDVAFVLDTTGSMSEEIGSVKATIAKVTSRLELPNTRVRMGLVEYKDRTDPFVARVFHMTTDLPAFEKQVSFLNASGGGDTPEAVNEGLHAGLTRLSWSDDSIARFAFLIGDAPPHLDYQKDYDYAADMKDASHRGIQVFTIAASGMDDLGQAVWRQIAQYTGATNLFVLRGGAGPQSTGAGDPKTSCGTRVDNYSSGNLDELIVSKIQHEVRSIDRDPTRIAGLYEDENQKPCDKRVAWQD